MSGDPHTRSAHRASPVGGLASLSAQALLRQAQTGPARARQAIVKQARAARARHEAEEPAPGAPCRLGVGERTSGDLATIWQAAAFKPPSGRSTARLAPADRASAGPAPADRVTARPTAAGDQAAAGSHAAAGQTAAGHQAAAVRAGRAARERAAHAAPQHRQARIPPAFGAPARAHHGVVASGGRSRTRPEFAVLPPRIQHGLTALLHHPRTRHGLAALARLPHLDRAATPTLREPQQALQTMLRGLAALIVLAIVGLSTFFIIAEESRGGPGHESAAAPGTEPGIASRALDAEPLTQREVFPEPSVQPPGSAAGYQVTMTHSDTSCRIATTGELGALLEDHACEQVVRARLTAPYGGYQVTTGIFNLADAGGAARVSEVAGTLVETGRGTFATLGGSAGDPFTEPLAQVGWRSRGHFLLYCVVARPDGRLVTDDDPYAARISAEMVDGYLAEQVVGKRTLDP